MHGDTLDEPDENYFVNLTVVSGDVVLGDGQGEGTIVDDDPLAALAVGDASVTEGNSGTTTATLPGHTLVRRAGRRSPSTGTRPTERRRRPPTTRARAARSPSHPGETTKQVSVSVNGDTQVEPDETFLVQLTNETNATVEDGTGVGTDRQRRLVRPAASTTASATSSTAATSSATATASAASTACHRRPLRPSRASRGRSSATAARSWARPSATSSWGRSTAT